MRNRVRHVSALLAVIALAMAALTTPWAASDSPTTPAEHLTKVQQAQALYDQGNFAAAGALAAQVTAEDPINGKLWKLEANAYRRAGNAAEAVKAYEEVGKLNFDIFSDALAAARLYAGSLGDKAAALRWLDRALYTLRMPGRTDLAADPAFASMVNDANFKKLAGVPLNPVTNRNAKWRKDIDFLVEESQRLHNSPRREAFSKKFVNYAERIKDDVPTLSDTDIFLRCQRLMVLLHDGHTRFMGQGGFSSFSTTPTVQMDLWGFSDGFFIFGGQGAALDNVGAKILKANGVPWEKIVERAEPYVSRDNFDTVKWSTWRTLSFPRVLHKVGGLASLDATVATFTVRDRTGVVKDIQVPIAPGNRRGKLVPSLISGNPAPLYLQRLNDTVWAAPVADLDGVWFQFNNVLDDPVQPKSIAQIAADIRTMLADNDAHNLIIDTRRNNGGNSGLIAPLLQVMAAFKREDPANRIFAITGRNAFSATPLFLGELEQLLPDTIYVGEPAAAGPNFTGEEGPIVTLPYSRNTANISHVWHGTNHGLGPNDRREYIPIDMPVELSSTDYFDNVDPAYNAIEDFLDN